MYQLLDFILHIDQQLVAIIATYGTSTYAIIFAIIFAETGLVITPFLPGDSLLFAAGALAATTALDPWPLFLVLTAAAIAGDNTNYWIGRLLGDRLLAAKKPIINRRYLERAHAFYEKYGPATVVVARFVPIVRTFAPFAAGVSRMTYRHFLPYSIGGGVLWIGLFVWGGYFFGNLPVVKANFELVVLGIIAVSVLPPLIEVLRARTRH